MTNLESLTQAQQELYDWLIEYIRKLYDWLIEYIRTTQHAPSIRQMMRAMNLRSPAPIQSRLERLRAKEHAPCGFSNNQCKVYQF